MKVEAGAITSHDQNDQAGAPAAVPTRRLEALLHFGALMLSAGDTAFRVRRSMEAIARDLGFDSFSVQVGARNLVASGRRDRQTATLVRDVDVHP